MHSAIRLRPHYDSPSVLRGKAKNLAAAIRRGQHVVFQTGESLSPLTTLEPSCKGSTSASDSRVCTSEMAVAQTLSELEGALPTVTHWVITALVEQGLVRHVITQNVDGLHLRSGVSRAKLTEIYGDAFCETCKTCGWECFHDYCMISSTTRKGEPSRSTGGTCPDCGGDLEDNLVDIGDDLPRAEYLLARDNAKKADVFVVLGGSLKLFPANEFSEIADANGATLAIVHPMPTPLDDKASMRIFSNSDSLMQLVGEELGVSNSSFGVRRQVIVGHEVVMQTPDERGCTIFLCGDSGFELAGVDRIDTVHVKDCGEHVRWTTTTQGNLVTALIRPSDSDRSMTFVISIFFFEFKPVVIKYNANLAHKRAQHSHLLMLRPLDANESKSASSNLLPPSAEPPTNLEWPSSGDEDALRSLGDNSDEEHSASRKRKRSEQIVATTSIVQDVPQILIASTPTGTKNGSAASKRKRKKTSAERDALPTGPLLHVRASLVKPGARVMVDWKGFGELYAGKVKQRSKGPHGRFDIDYDDGESERMVTIDRIFVFADTPQQELELDMLG